MEAADAIVIGAGPAGLFCAIHAAVPGYRIIILEKNARPGAKLLLAGSGQCNITHGGEIRDFLTHYGNHGRFLRSALMSFSNRDLVEFFHERGLAMETEKNGKVFPETRNSGDVLEILLDECRKCGVIIRYGEPVRELLRAEEGFRITTGSGVYQAKSVVIATGGASYQKTGSTGDGYRLAGALDQPVTETAPSLAPVLIREYPFADLAGISFENLPFTVWRSGRKAGSWHGDILFTHTGLSGPGILDASRDIRAGDVIRIAFAGDRTREIFTDELTGLVQANGPRLVRILLAGFSVPDRLQKKILSLAGIPEDLTCAHLTSKQRSQIIAYCTEFPLTVDRLGDFSIAMATRGGVALDDVNQKTMESKCVPGLFFAGEVLDIDGDTGGYNLQAAFSTGYCAAMGLRASLGDISNRST